MVGDPRHDLVLQRLANADGADVDETARFLLKRELDESLPERFLVFDDCADFLRVFESQIDHFAVGAFDARRLAGLELYLIRQDPIIVHCPRKTHRLLHIGQVERRRAYVFFVLDQIDRENALVQPECHRFPVFPEDLVQLLLVLVGFQVDLLGLVDDEILSGSFV